MSSEDRPVSRRIVRRIAALGLVVASVAALAGLLPANAQTSPCETLLAVYNSGSPSTRQAVLPYLQAFNCEIPNGTVPPTTAPPTTTPPTTAPPTTVPPTTTPPTTIPPTTTPPTTVSPSVGRCQALQSFYNSTTDPFIRGAIAAQIQATPGCTVPNGTG